MLVVSTPPKSIRSPGGAGAVMWHSYQPSGANRVRVVAAGAEIEGIDEDRVGAWLVANVAGAEGPFRYERIAGGRSNLTFLVVDADGRRWALRRPPLGKGLGSAHDMGREHRVIRRSDRPPSRSRRSPATAKTRPSTTPRST